MTYYFGFTTSKHLYLAADRRRIYEGSKGDVDDTTSKIHQVGRWNILVGAGFMHFVDDLVAPQAGSVFGQKRLDLQVVEASLPKLAGQLRQGHIQLANQLDRATVELHTRFTLAGVDVSNVPFSLEWTSDDGFQRAVRGPHAFSLPRNPAELAELRPMIEQLRERAERGDSFKRMTAGVAAVMAWVAERDDTVSQAGDLIRLGGILNRRTLFR